MLDIKLTAQQQKAVNAAFVDLDERRKNLAIEMVIAFMRSHQTLNYNTVAVTYQLPFLPGIAACVKARDLEAEDTLEQERRKPVEEAQLKLMMAQAKQSFRAEHAYDGQPLPEDEPR